MRATLVALAVAVAAGAGVPGEAATVPAIRSGVLHPERLTQVAWHGKRYATASGETVKVFVSPAYASDSAAGQRWANFFASLLHGSELSLLTAYVAPFDEVQDLCQSNGEALGCYYGNKLVTIGEAVDGVQPTSVATHEYGHHVAWNRSNAPWPAIDWGTKRWASDMNVCARTAAGTAFPGDEGWEYMLNPGEAFAESYRVLMETQAGLPFTWPILDPSFSPDATALQAVRDDVVNPWVSPPTRTIRARFASGRRSWTMKLATPLDGDLSVRLAQGADDVQLLAGDRRVLARGSWTTNGGRSLAYRICGERSLVLRVTKGAQARRFTLAIGEP
jgi:hypothetical protein